MTAIGHSRDRIRYGRAVPLPPTTRLSSVPPRRPTASVDTADPKNTGAPAYFTAATVAAFAVSGLNVPGAIGAARTAGHVRRSPTGNQASSVRAARRAAQPHRARRGRAASAGCAPPGPRRCGRCSKAAPRAPGSPPRRPGPSGSSRSAAITADRRLRRVRPVEPRAHRPGLRVPDRHAGARARRRHVIFASYDGAYGNKIAIQHADGTGHLVRPPVGLRASPVGDKVQGRRADRPRREHRQHDRPAPAPRDPARTTDDPVDPLPWLRAHGVDAC